MQLEGIEVRVLKGKNKVGASRLSSPEYVSFSGLSKFSPQSLRKYLSGYFQKTQKQNIKSIVFLAAGLKEPADFRIFSKIAAQELLGFVRTKKNINLKKVSFIGEADSTYMILKKNIISYLGHLKNNKGPFLTVDGIVFYKQGIIMIKRANPPLGWALPGVLSIMAKN